LESELFKTRRSSRGHTVVMFQTPSLMNPTDMERIGASLGRMAEGLAGGRLVLDFSKVQFLSSQAVGVIITLNKKLATKAAPGETLVLCGVGPQLMQLLKITRLDRILTIKDTQKEAVAA
jgi:anti-sigma B factor antagonist